MASNTPAAPLPAEIKSELHLLRKRNKELQSQLDELRQNASQNEKQLNGGNASNSNNNAKTLHHRSVHEESFHDEESLPAPKTPLTTTKINGTGATSLNPPASPKPTQKHHAEGFVTPKQSNRTTPSKDKRGDYKQVFDIEESGIPPSISNESADESANESDELIHDDSSHNKHQNRRRLRRRVHHFESFWHDIKERAGWLIGLLFLQSCSSFIIQYNESFLQDHMVIVQFLTMLVGAGGNAGNQAAVRVIRGLAVGTLNDRTMRPFLKGEVKMAFGLSALLGLTGFIRAAIFRTPAGETVAVTTSLCAIVLISVGIGNMLPLGMKKVGIDPAHSSTTIQVVMDIMGVLITVCVSSIVLSFGVFKHDEDSETSAETVT